VSVKHKKDKTSLSQSGLLSEQKSGGLYRRVGQGEVKPKSVCLQMGEGKPSGKKKRIKPTTGVMRSA
jgi:hypothetical protein